VLEENNILPIPLVLVQATHQAAGWSSSDVVADRQPGKHGVTSALGLAVTDYVCCAGTRNAPAFTIKDVQQSVA
jgi:hypothetical protein